LGGKFIAMHIPQEEVGDCVEREEIIVTIVTVVRNDATRLDKTIRSLKSYYGDTRFEHIIIDGNSNDGTLSLISEANKYINVKSLSEPDHGLYDGMNKGTDLSKGKFLLFLNCGDEILVSSNQLFSLVGQLLENSLDIACFPCLIQQEKSAYILTPHKPSRYMTPTSHQAMLFSKSFMTNHSYDIRYKVAADYDLYLRADPSRVINIQSRDPITSIELEGYASNNPTLAYKEYIQIACRHLHGAEKLFSLLRIVTKAGVVIFFKKILPKSLILNLRKLL